GRQGRVARGLHDRPMKIAVRTDHLLDGPALGDPVQVPTHLDQLFVGDARGGHSGGVGFQDPSDLEEFDECLSAGDIGDHTEVVQQITWAQTGDVGTRAVPDLQDTHDRQGSDRLTHRAAREPQEGRELAFGGQTLAGTQLSHGDHVRDLFDGTLCHRGACGVALTAHGHGATPPPGFLDTAEQPEYKRSYQNLKLVP